MGSAAQSCRHPTSRRKAPLLETQGEDGDAPLRRQPACTFSDRRQHRLLLRLPPGGREEGEVRVRCDSSEPHGALWFISHRHTPADTRPPRPCHSLLVLGCTVPLLESGRQVGDGDKLVYRLAVRCPPSLPDTSHQHHSSIGKHAQQQQQQQRFFSAGSQIMAGIRGESARGGRRVGAP